jgi:prophage regulatory protein
MHYESIPATGFVRLQTILKVFPISKSSWWAGVKDGRYPKSVKLGGGRATAWRAEDIHELIARTNTEVQQ